MALCQRFLGSGVGSKAIVGVTGLLLSGFTLAHMSGHLLMFAGPDAYNGYAAKLKSLGALLWLARGGLLLTFLVHVGLALKLNLENKLARPEKYAFEATIKATFASRYMVHTGLLIFTFLLYHLGHFTFRIVDPATSAVPAEDVYGMMIAGFTNPFISAFYVLAMAALALHLRHGFASAFQSLGINHPNINKCLGQTAIAFSVLVFVGYSSIPIAILMGLIR
jgi:succinate dehydrogenase / fumarate reductase cytochrome b subunit